MTNIIRLIGKALATATLALVCCSAEAQIANSKGWHGFLKVRPGRELYAEFFAPQPGKPIVILLNGLTYSTRQFDKYTDQLTGRGIGVFRFDFDGMGQSLLKYAPSMAPYPVEQQIDDTRTILMAAGLRPPYNFAGLSYGGGIAMGYALKYPREIRNLILIAPYSERLRDQDRTIETQINATRIMFPANPATDDELYDWFLHQIIYATYPAAEPITLENPYKLEAVYNLVRGIRKFKPVDHAAQLPPSTVHLMQAAQDQYIPVDVLHKLWDMTNPAARMSYVYVYETEHKMPEAIPEFTAKWTWQILKGNPLLRGGTKFEAWGRQGVVKLNGRVVPMQD